VTRRWPLTIVAGGLGVAAIVAPTLIAVRLVDHSRAIAEPKTGAQLAFVASPLAPALASSDAASNAVATPGSAASPGLASPAPSILAPAAQHLPTRLSDGRELTIDAVVSAHEVVGIARPRGAAASGQSSGPYALVVVDPSADVVTATLVTGDDSADPNGPAADARTTIVDADDMSGDFVAWADDAGVHVFSLSAQAMIGTFAVGRDHPTGVDIQWPWLSYTVDGSAHRVDLRSGVDTVS